VTVRREARTGGNSPPVRIFFGARAIAVAAAIAVLPALMLSPAAASAQTVASPSAGHGITEFYRARAGRPLWLAPEAGNAAQPLLEHLDTAAVDRLNPGKYRTREIRRALQAAWGGRASAVQRAERLLSESFVEYANDLQRLPNPTTYFVEPQVAPRPRTARAWLDQAAAAPSLQQFTADMAWMNPMYGQLRKALVSGNHADPAQRQLLSVNLDRARALPGGRGRYIVVNAAAQRLFVYQNGDVVDSMRVVVGKPKYPTPMMAALVRYASLNPYWNVPPDLAAERIAPSVVKEGLGYLRTRGYEVLSDWGDGARVVDPSGVDWKAVADGTTEVRIRQLPGPHNAMGKMKFMFPNREGIYLHDTPEKELLTEASRLFSGGCVRLEDASRLGEWMFGRALQAQGSDPEQRVDLPQPVPVYITYLTAVPSGSSIAWYDDIYGRDGVRTAGTSAGAPVVAR
jgi:murein L,D-transpeptidase YcbB/YkuD